MGIGNHLRQFLKNCLNIHFFMYDLEKIPLTWFFILKLIMTMKPDCIHGAQLWTKEKFKTLGEFSSSTSISECTIIGYAYKIIQSNRRSEEKVGGEHKGIMCVCDIWCLVVGAKDMIIHPILWDSTKVSKCLICFMNSLHVMVLDEYYLILLLQSI